MLHNEQTHPDLRRRKSKTVCTTARTRKSLHRSNRNAPNTSVPKSECKTEPRSPCSNLAFRGSNVTTCALTERLLWNTGRPPMLVHGGQSAPSRATFACNIGGRRRQRRHASSLFAPVAKKRRAPSTTAPCEERPCAPGGRKLENRGGARRSE